MNDFIDYADDIDETNKVWRVFSKYEDKCQSTADFISDFLKAIPAEPRTQLVFTVYVCNRSNYKFKNLNNRPIVRCAYGDCMNFQEFCNFLFDKCGSSGWDILHTGFGSFKVMVDGHMRQVYEVYAEDKQK